MKKAMATATISLALFFVGLGMPALNVSSVQAEAVKEEVCPTCSTVLSTGTKPVVEMLQGKKHTCPDCKKDFTIAAANVHECPTCNKAVLECPTCKHLSLAS